MTEALTVDTSAAGARAGGIVFLCHNSKDKDAIRNIADALELRYGRGFFLDAYAIPVGEAFLDWIERSLEASSGCAIFLSGNGWGPTHLWEAEKALSLYRRKDRYKLIPVALPGIAEGDMEKLGAGKVFQELNRADFSRRLDDPDSLAKLEAALSGRELPQDRGPARLTPYQVRRDAERWRASAEGSILYRGAQIDEAERLLADNPDYVVPEAIAPFLAASRRRQRDALRRLAVGSTLAAVLILALAIAAVFGYWSAERRREASLSRELAITSRDAVGPAYALLLAVRSLEVSGTPEAQGNLVNALDQWRHLRRVMHFGSSIEALAVRAPDHVLAVATQDGTLRFLRGDGSEAGKRQSIRDGHATSLAFSSGGHDLWIGRDDGAVELRSGDAASIVVPAPTRRGIGEDLRVTAIANQPGGDLLAAGRGNGTLVLIDARRRTASAIDGVDGFGVTSIAFDASGRWLAIGFGNGELMLLDPSRPGEVQRMPRFGDRIVGFGFVREADELRVVSASAAEYSVKLEQGEWRRRFLANLTPLLTAAAVDGQGNAATGDGDGSVRIVDPIGAETDFAARRGHANPVTRIFFGGGFLVSGSSDGTLDLWDVDGRQGLGLPLPNPCVEVTSLRVDRAGRPVAACDKPGDVRTLADGVWRVDADLKALTIQSLGDDAFALPPKRATAGGFVEIADDEVTDVALSKDGGGMLWATRQKDILWRAREDDGAVRTFAASTAATGAIAISDDGATGAALIDDAGDVRVRGPSVPPGSDGIVRTAASVRSLGLDPRGRWLAVGFADGTIGLWTVAGVPLHAPSAVHGSPVERLVFAPDGSQLFSSGSGGGGSDKTVAVTDVPGFRAAVRLQTRQAAGAAVGMDAGDLDGFLAVADHDGEVLLWARDPPHFVTSLKAGVSAVSGVAIDNARKRIFTASGDGTFASWSLDPLVWTALACYKANRDLTKDEWREVMAGEDYSASCGRNALKALASHRRSSPPISGRGR